MTQPHGWDLVSCWWSEVIELMYCIAVEYTDIPQATGSRDHENHNGPRKDLA